MTYLLQGLPPDLTNREISQLQSSLPGSLDRSQCAIEPVHHQRQPSILHRSIAALIVAISFIVRFALPYIKYLLALAHNYEREHHMTERGLALTINIIDSCGKKSLGSMRTVMENPLVMAATAYCIEGVCGGLNQGLGEGMKVIEAQNDP